jgi:integrase
MVRNASPRVKNLTEVVDGPGEILLPRMMTTVQLISAFETHLEADLHVGKCSAETFRHYRSQLRHLRFAQDGTLANRLATSLNMSDLAGFPVAAQRAVKRLFRWAKIPDPYFFADVYAATPPPPPLPPAAADPSAGEPQTTTAQLIEAYETFLKASAASGRCSERTYRYYQCGLRHLRLATDPQGRKIASRPAASLTFVDLAGLPPTAAVTRAVKRLYRWAKLPDPLADVAVPPFGQRTRVLLPSEFRRLRQVCNPALRTILWFFSQTGARPLELRHLTWRQVNEKDRVLVLTDFTARDLRKDGMRLRIIPMSAPAARALAYWRQKTRPSPERFVFWSHRRKPWSSNSLRCAVARARKRARLNKPGMEKIVAYSLRHTFATHAVANGIQETLLADIMGHVDLSTTRRYLHRSKEDMVKGLDAALRRRPVN